jgi:hypothetical protein
MDGATGTMFLDRAGDDQSVAYPFETVAGGERVVDCEPGGIGLSDDVVVVVGGLDDLVGRVEAYLDGEVTEPGETYGYLYTEYEPDDHLLGLFPRGVAIQTGPPQTHEFTCIECGRAVETGTDAFALGNFNLLVHDDCGVAFVDSLRTLRERVRRGEESADP